MLGIPARPTGLGFVREMHLSGPQNMFAEAITFADQGEVLNIFFSFNGLMDFGVKFIVLLGLDKF